MEKRLLNITETAEYLGITKGTLYVWVCHKKVPYLKIGRLVKFDIKKLDKWIDSMQVNVSRNDSFSLDNLV